jgi:hypothetical protein
MTSSVPLFPNATGSAQVGTAGTGGCGQWTGDTGPWVALVEVHWIRVWVKLIHASRCMHVTGVRA